MDRKCVDLSEGGWGVRRAESTWRSQLPNHEGRCVVGILCSRQDASGARNNYVSNYAEAVLASGGEPRLLYPQRGTIDSQMQAVDALIVPGGDDVTPSFYGMEKGPGMADSRLDPALDAFEIDMLREAFEEGMPLLGICRGEQIINVAGGGTLVQDIPTEFTPANDNSRIDHKGGYDAVHEIHLAEGSRMRETLGTASIVANSVHHQCIAAVSPLFRVVAHALDGVPEAIERKDLPTQAGVQFHPERARRYDPRFQRLFDRLVDDGVEYNFGDRQLGMARSA